MRAFAAGTIRIGAFACAALAALPAIATTPGLDAEVGTPIGSGLRPDVSFAEAGSAVLDFDDPAIATYAVSALAVNANGYWLLGHHLAALGANEDIAIARLGLDGAPDPSFGADGYLTAPSSFAVVTDVARAGTRFHAAGLPPVMALGLGTPEIACVETDGSACADFGGGGDIVLDGFARADVKLLARDGALFAIGSTDGGIAVARLDAGSGAFDAAFGNGGVAEFDPGFSGAGTASVADAIFADDGAGHTRLLVGGGAATDAGGTTGYVLALDPDSGAADASFGTGGIAPVALALGSGADEDDVAALAEDAAHRIVVAGNANYQDGGGSAIQDVMLARLGTDGTPDATFAGGGITHAAVGHGIEVTAAALRADGRIVVAMSSLGLDPDPESDHHEQSLIEFDASGTSVRSTVSLQFDGDGITGPESLPVAVAVDAGDRVLLAGSHYYGASGTLLTPGVWMTLSRFVADSIFAASFDPD